MKRLMILFLWVTGIVLPAMVYFYPVDVGESIFEAQMQWMGLESEIREGYEVYSKNQCPEQAATSSSRDGGCPCVLMVHGLGDHVYTWRKVLDLAEEYPARWSVPNLPGSGRSTVFDAVSDYSVTNMAKDLWRVVGSECEQWSLVGNSLGGWVAVKMALQKPDRVNHLLLVNPAGVSFDYSKLVEVYAHPNADGLREMADLTYYESKSWIPSFVFKDLAERLQGMPIRELLKAQRGEFIPEEELKQLRVPTWLFWGEGDRALGSSVAEAYSEHLPSADVQYLEECGHLPQQECPQRLWSGLENVLNAAKSSQ